ncbi:hypothetical protein GCM10009127_10890 [Alteraurantiacibacter aestuarii]|uniref:DUF2061 domain-containing protein n=1 Tax=Alteraurantiacibacter aestuarii TaxID=650004 RepID=A0A844ZKR9_9SPHN|nr:DUF2061 domain-containing protein [Alteraurantiacibacter aestuarii]MXO87477.1 DUF2061 domain-containing protein [Alteraurantiacibacter aestuarii]
MFLFSGREKHSRSLVKAISWRVLGSIDTFLLSWFFTGSPKAAGAIATTEVLTKMILYYVHERAWSSVGWGFASEEEALDAGQVKPTIAEVIEEGGQ